MFLPDVFLDMAYNDVGCSIALNTVLPILSTDHKMLETKYKISLKIEI